MLRKAIPSTIGLRKVTSLVVCLCRLHNYCINRRIQASAKGEKVPVGAVPVPLAVDRLDIAGNGGFLDTEEVNTEQAAASLLGAGHHFEDTSESYRRQFARRGIVRNKEVLPRDIMHTAVAEGGFKRRTPAHWLKEKK